ncbi:MAG: hypothetical protein B7Z73_06220 [Planctomycetia bacterium 21-64-5]|nr:MAG: hypothetical protein B7Z73_06220 [Planctomycetia bacterium 21-64-5]HQU42035.1 hypothetical protein [Pirellulales bacterium]
MNTSHRLRSTDKLARTIAAELPRRRPCIEVVDPTMAEVLREKTEWQRLEIAAGMWRSARRMVQAVIAHENPAWTTDQVDREVASRMSHGLV